MFFSRFSWKLYETWQIYRQWPPVCGEYRFPEKKSSTFQGLFQGHFRSFQGHFQCHSRCITVKKYRVTQQNLEFPCNLPPSHRSVRTGRWKLLFWTLFCVFFIEINSFMIIWGKETQERLKHRNTLGCLDQYAAQNSKYAHSIWSHHETFTLWNSLCQGAVPMAVLWIGSLPPNSLNSPNSQTSWSH